MFIESDFDNRQFADNLTTLREKAELSIDDLAKQVGVVPDIVESWEDAQKRPNEEQKCRLEEVFDWPLTLPPRKLTTVKIGDWEKLTDERIAPFVREMLIAGFPSILCVVDNLGVSIGWTKPDRIALFLNIVTTFEEGSETMYSRVNEEIESTGRIPKWEYTLNLIDACYQEDGSFLPAPGPIFGLHVLMRIPPHDLPTVVERLKKYNAFRAAQPGKKRRASGASHRVYLPVPSPKGLYQYSVWATPVSEETSIIDNIPHLTDQIAYRDLVRVSPNGDFLELLERLTRTKHAKYNAANTRKEAERQWKTIVDHFEKQGVFCESATAGLFAMAVPGNVTDDRFLELWNQCPVKLQPCGQGQDQTQ